MISIMCSRAMEIRLLKCQRKISPCIRNAFEEHTIYISVFGYQSDSTEA